MAGCGGDDEEDLCLTVGECIAFPADAAGVTAADVVNCSEPHDVEVYAVVELAEDSHRPASVEAALADEEISAVCLSEAERRVDLALIGDGGYELQPLLVDAEAWAAGLHEVYCVVDAIGRRAEGSVLLGSG